jgi:arsenite-transporting ATPase
VSTDPAHSLGDALDVDLKSSHGKKIQMTDPLTGGKLYAMEVDTDAALEKFQNALGTFDVAKLSQALGVQPELLEGLGLGELSSMIKNPPPGLDELVALSNILNDPEIAREFDVVVVDTAPTGHTLRMLALPEFLDGFLGKLLELRMKLSGVANMLQSFLGGGDAAAARAQTVDDALSKLEEFRVQMGTLRKQLKDSETTEFVVVSVPTKLSVNESKRLMKELDSQGVKVSNIVINQCVVGDGENDSTAESNEAMKNYYDRRKAGQGRWINELKSATNDVSASEEYKSNGGGEIQVTEVPFFDVELVGTPALAYLGQSSFANDPNFDNLINDSEGEAKFVICGGKGGVGKTTTSSSIAVTMAAAGRNVALVSTDPAHSLGDAFDLDFRGGELVDVPLIGVPPSDGSLSVLEVDPSKSLGEFKVLIDNLIGSGDSSSSSSGTAGDFSKTIRELGEVFDTLPAGTDEVVALAKVVNLVKKGGFDRIVLDTAPTGHTLRMLSTPGFISELIDKVLAISKKVNSNSMVKMMISSATKGEDYDEKAEAASRALRSFQLQMYDLEDLFANAEQTEFLIVTVATELAVRESVRLLNDLTFEAPDMPIKVRNVVVNQVLKDDGSDVTIFLNRVAESQQSSIKDLREEVDRLGKTIEITEVPYLDTEPRGVFGLKVLSAELLKEDEVIAN